VKKRDLYSARLLAPPAVVDTKLANHPWMFQQGAIDSIGQRVALAEDPRDLAKELLDIEAPLERIFLKLAETSLISSVVSQQSVFFEN
jgi:hypothetical protein